MFNWVTYLLLSVDVSPWIKREMDHRPAVNSFLKELSNSCLDHLKKKTTKFSSPLGYVFVTISSIKEILSLERAVFDTLNDLNE